MGTVVIFTHLKDCLKTVRSAISFWASVICQALCQELRTERVKTRPDLWFSEDSRLAVEVCRSRKQNYGQWKASGRARAPYKGAPLARGLQLCKSKQTEGARSPNRMDSEGKNHLSGSSPVDYLANANIAELQNNRSQYHKSNTRSVQNYTMFNLAKNTFFKT